MHHCVRWGWTPLLDRDLTTNGHAAEISRPCSALFSALLALRVGRIMHDVPPTSSVFRHSYQVLLCSSGPCSYIVHPVDPRSSLSPSSRNLALYDLLFQE